MADDPVVNPERRRMLTTAASVVGGVGVAAAAWPFIASMEPSARAQAAGAPVEVDLSEIAPGEKKVVGWRGKPVWIVHRTPTMMKTLGEDTDKLRDPDSEVASQTPPFARNEYRAIRPEYLVLVGICTHLGCSPTYRPEPASPDLGPDWLGGFFCPCHGSRFDIAGRVFKGVPVPSNLEVPPYRYLSETRLLIGQTQEEADV